MIVKNEPERQNENRDHLASCHSYRVVRPLETKERTAQKSRPFKTRGCCEIRLYSFKFSCHEAKTQTPKTTKRQQEFSHPFWSARNLFFQDQVLRRHKVFLRPFSDLWPHGAVLTLTSSAISEHSVAVGAAARVGPRCVGADADAQASSTLRPQTALVYV